MRLHALMYRYALMRGMAVDRIRILRSLIQEPAQIGLGGWMAAKPLSTAGASCEAGRCVMMACSLEKWDQ
jgi:hypothetical protein